MKTRISEQEKRTVDCPKCLAKAGKACRGSRIPGANTFGGGWGGPPDLDRAHDERRRAYVVHKARHSFTIGV
ncbi:MAG TPA: hypothetical protein VIG47_08695 [Gemmatimonadaceae bacterium]|jgi:hypothetical protein